MNVTLATDPQSWNDYLVASNYGDILQSWQWGQVKESELWQPLRLIVQNNKKTVGQAQVLIRQLPLGFKLYYMPRGPVLDYASPDAPTILAAILDYTATHAKQHRGLLIKIGPSVTAHQAPALPKTLTNLHLKPAAHSIQTKYTRLINLDQSDADLLNSFDKDTRNLVRRAAREGVIVDCFTDIDDTKALRIFHNLYVSTSERASFHARPWSQMVRLWEIMAPQGMAYIYTATANDTPMASSLVLKLGDTAYQLWSGSRRDTAKKYPTYALQWTIMQHMKQQGVKTYDMWGVAPTDDPTHPWAGLTLFKKGFGGTKVELIGDYDLPTTPLYPAYQVALTLRQKLLGLKA